MTLNSNRIQSSWIEMVLSQMYGRRILGKPAFSHNIIDVDVNWKEVRIVQQPCTRIALRGLAGILQNVLYSAVHRNTCAVL